MFCSTCGKTIIEGLNYCKNCGAKMRDPKEGYIGALSEASFNTLLAGVMGIPIAGIGIVVGLMSVMKEFGFSVELIIAFTVMSFVLLLAAEAIFIWLLWTRAQTSKATGENSQSKDIARIKQAAIKELNQAQTQEFVSPLPGFSEHATQPLETVPRNLKKS